MKCLRRDVTWAQTQGRTHRGSASHRSITSSLHTQSPCPGSLSQTEASQLQWPCVSSLPCVAAGPHDLSEKAEKEQLSDSAWQEQNEHWTSESPWVLGNRWGGIAAQGTSCECISYPCSHLGCHSSCAMPRARAHSSAKLQKGKHGIVLSCSRCQWVTTEPCERKSILGWVSEGLSMFHRSITNNLPLNVATILHCTYPRAILDNIIFFYVVCQ